jgi:hypothetical protein
MKCNVCKQEMELWQSTIIDGQLIKRYRCTCGNEQAEIVGKDKPKDKGT